VFIVITAMFVDKNGDESNLLLVVGVVIVVSVIAFVAIIVGVIFLLLYIIKIKRRAANKRM